MQEFKEFFNKLAMEEGNKFVRHLQAACGEKSEELLKSVEGETISTDWKKHIEVLKGSTQVELIELSDWIKQQYKIVDIVFDGAASGESKDDEEVSDKPKTSTLTITTIGNKMVVVKVIKEFKAIDSLKGAMDIMKQLTNAKGGIEFKDLVPEDLDKLKGLLEKDKSNVFTVV